MQTQTPQPSKKEKYGIVNITLTITNILIAVAIVWILSQSTSAQKLIEEQQQRQISPIMGDLDYLYMQEKTEKISSELGYPVELYRYGNITILDETHTIKDKQLEYCTTIGGLTRYKTQNKIIGKLGVVALIGDSEGKLAKQTDIAHDGIYEQDQLDNIKICDQIDITTLNNGEYTLTIMAIDYYHEIKTTKEAGFTI